MLDDSAGQLKKYGGQGAEIQARAEQADAAAEADEHRALRYDVGEGLLEIALVLSSLYFISKKKMFPIFGIIAGFTGAVIAITGLFG
jgi:hypothetical protein